MTFGQKVKLDNFKAQYNSLQQQIQESKKSLDKVIAERNDIEEAERKFQKEIQKKQSYIDLLDFRIGDKSNEIKRNDKQLNSTLSEIEEIKYYKGKVLDQLNYEIENSKKYINQLLDKTKFCNDNISKTEERINFLDKKYIESKKSFDSSNKNLNTQIIDKKDKLSKIESKLENITDKFNQKEEGQKLKEQKLKDREKELIHLMSTFKTNETIRKDRIKKLDQRERDISVVVRRLKKIYKERYPNLQLKI